MSSNVPPTADSENSSASSLRPPTGLPSSEATLVPTAPADNFADRSVAPKLSIFPNPPDPKAWLPGTPYKYPVPGGGEHWETCSTVIQKHDKGLCEIWTDEVDKLLIFAGLFSAAVTAFVIESYQWLQPDSNDITNQLLSQISLQLGGVDELRNKGFVTASLPLRPSSSNTWLTAVERINIFWFLSLTLSLATVLIGILCMQWLREYRRDAALPHSDSIALRQMRYEGLMTWGVPSILSSLPLILQTALMFFFIGVLDLLWTLDHVVAVPITIAVGLLSVFLFATTALPALQILVSGHNRFRFAQCAYKSPQSWSFLRLTLFSLKVLESLSRIVRMQKRFSQRLHSFVRCRNWNGHDSIWQKVRREELSQSPSASSQSYQEPQDDLAAGIIWIDRNFRQNVEVVHALHHCLRDVHLSTAARVVSALDSRVADRLSWLLKPQRLRSYTGELRFLQPHSELQRDLIMAYFHEIHRPIHSTSSVHQLEHIIRLMNSSEHLRQRPYLEWPIQDIQDYPEEIAHEYIVCLVTAFRNSKSFTHSETLGTWKMIHDLCRGLNERDRPSGATKVLLVSVLIDQLTQWLTRPSAHVSLNRAERVRLCVHGLINLFFPWPSMTMKRLRSFHQDISAVYRMIESLDDLLIDLNFQDVTRALVLEPSHQNGWLSLKRQLEPTRKSDQDY